LPLAGAMPRSISGPGASTSAALEAMPSARRGASARGGGKKGGTPRKNCRLSQKTGVYTPLMEKIWFNQWCRTFNEENLNRWCTKNWMVSDLNGVHIASWPLKAWSFGFHVVARPKRYVLIKQWENSGSGDDSSWKGPSWFKMGYTLSHWVKDSPSSCLKSKDPKLKRLVVPNSLWPTPHKF
jgi:hypothetical protein